MHLHDIRGQAQAQASCKAIEKLNYERAARQASTSCSLFTALSSINAFRMTANLSDLLS